MLFLWVLYLAEPQAPFLPLSLYTAVLVHPAPANGEADIHNRGQDGAKPLPGRCHHRSILCKAATVLGGLWVSGANLDFSSHADRPGHIPRCRGILPWYGALWGCSQHPVSLETLVYRAAVSSCATEPLGPAPSLLSSHHRPQLRARRGTKKQIIYAETTYSAVVSPAPRSSLLLMTSPEPCWEGILKRRARKQAGCLW